MISRDEPPSPLEQLPDEMLLHILSFFNKKELGSIAPVNKKFNRLVHDKQLQENAPWPLLDYTQPQLDQIKNFNNDKLIRQVEWLSDTKIASLSIHDVKIWDVHTQTCLKTFRLTESEYSSKYCCCFKKIGDKLFIGANAGKIYQWDYQLEQSATCIRYANRGDYKDYEVYEYYENIVDITPLPQSPGNKMLISICSYSATGRVDLVKIFDLDNHQEENLDICSPIFQFAHCTISDRSHDKRNVPLPFFVWVGDKLLYPHRIPLIELPGKRIAMAMNQSNGYLYVLDIKGARLFENSLYQSGDNMSVHINSLCLVSDHIVLVGAMEGHSDHMEGGRLYHWDLEKNTLTKQMFFDDKCDFPWSCRPISSGLHSIKKGPNGKIILAYGSEMKLISYPLLTPTIENNNDNNHPHEKKRKQITCENEPHGDLQSPQIKHRLI